jgi:hypothetical protein
MLEDIKRRRRMLQALNPFLGGMMEMFGGMGAFGGMGPFDDDDDYDYDDDDDDDDGW